MLLRSHLTRFHTAALFQGKKEKCCRKWLVIGPLSLSRIFFYNNKSCERPESINKFCVLKCCKHVAAPRPSNLIKLTRANSNSERYVSFFPNSLVFRVLYESTIPSMFGPLCPLSCLGKQQKLAMAASVSFSPPHLVQSALNEFDALRDDLIKNPPSPLCREWLTLGPHFSPRLTCLMLRSRRVRDRRD